MKWMSEEQKSPKERGEMYVNWQIYYMYQPSLGTWHKSQSSKFLRYDLGTVKYI